MLRGAKIKKYSRQRNLFHFFELNIIACLRLGRRICGGRLRRKALLLLLLLLHGISLNPFLFFGWLNKPE
jgi:hypothetical protein